MSRIFLSPPHMGSEERQFLLEAFDSNWIAPLGPHVDAFEREVSEAVGVSAAAALSSGTAALHLALVLLGVGPGDEVVVSDWTFAASVNVIRYVGATPVFVDADESTWTMDPDLLAEALQDRARKRGRPKAVISVDLYGQCADYERLGAVCARYGVPIIQDASESLGATYRGRPAGAQGLLAAYSFNGNKIITTSGGGMLVSANANLIAEARHLASQARDPAPHYQHSKVGFNYRLSNLLAAVGRAQFGRLQQRVEARRSNFAWYHSRLSALHGWSFMPEAPYGHSSRWLTCVAIADDTGVEPEMIRLALERDAIEARPLWKPMHMQPIFSGVPVYGGSVGEGFFRRGLCLPSGSALEECDRERVLATILSVVKERGGA